MTQQLPLPFPTVSPEFESDEVQANFEAIAKEFPLSRKSMALEGVHIVGAAGEPAFENSWTNYDAAYESAGFWKDPFDVVHLQGLVEAGTVPATIFTLPEGYRPVGQATFGVISNGAIGGIDITAAGGVYVFQGNNTYVQLNGISFRRAT
jgi:hypothetical protein